MINFKPVTLEDKARYDCYLLDDKERGCQYSFTNLYLWGQQQATIFQNHMVLFSQFNNHSVYSYPVGDGNKKPVLDAILADAKDRGIPCQITGLSADSMQTLEEFYPGMFRFHNDRDSYDYVYDIDNLADLKGKKYQRKRNHFYRFQDAFPNYTIEPFGEKNLSSVKQMVDKWYESRLLENPDSDYHMEQAALEKTFLHYRELKMEGLILLDGENVLAVTLGSRLSNNTFDVHFEKARLDANGAYTAINREFAQYIRNKYPEIQFLNREEDMGLEGLRKSKLSYHPHHMVEKYRASLLENKYED